MRSLNLLHWAGTLALAISLSPGRVVAQDTLSITGTFKMNAMYEPLEADLAAIYANGSNHWWRLTLNGVTYSHVHDLQTADNGAFSDLYFTYVHATSFVFEFFGPDAAALNSAVSSQLTRGSLTDGAFLYLLNWEYFDPDFPWDSGWYAEWSLGLLPFDDSDGVWFSASNGSHYPLFNVDSNGFPVVEPQRVSSPNTRIADRRNGNYGWLYSFNDIVDFCSGEEPIPPPPPPSPVQINIDDASVLEGNRGATVLQMTVTLSRTSNETVTVNCQTANGTASAGKDYTAASGMLTFQPGETTKTIAVSIKGDRQREPDETLTVRLSNAVGANLGRSIGTATILNDD